MIFKLIPLAIIQSMLLAAGQVMLKFGLARMEPFSCSTAFFKSVFVNWQFALSGICFGIGSVLWMYIVKHFPLSMSYPMVSLSYVFGMIASIIFFHETVDCQKGLGVILIIAGCLLIAK